MAPHIKKLNDDHASASIPKDLKEKKEECQVQKRTCDTCQRTPDRTRDNPHKCLIPKFPETPHFCPPKILKIWAFLTEMTPDLPAGGPNLTEH